MNFKSERTALKELSKTILKGSETLFNGIKYLYVIGEKDFYNIDSRDIFKIILNNITNQDALTPIGIRANQLNQKDITNDDFERLANIIPFSFAVRIPLLKGVKWEKKSLTDNQIKELFNLLVGGGARNYNEAVPVTFEEMRRQAKKGKNIAPYTSLWLWEYLTYYIPSFRDINNRNMFLHGCLQELLPIFDARLQQELESIILSSIIENNPIKNK